jgi:hypothetical protein
MIQSKQVGAPPSSSILNYRLTCGLFASVSARFVPKEDSVTSIGQSVMPRDRAGVTLTTYGRRRVAKSRAPVIRAIKILSAAAVLRAA